MICHIECSCQYLADKSVSYFALWSGVWCSLREAAVQLCMLATNTCIDCGSHALFVPCKLKQEGG
jgi:hypothetical protein